jgi:hypothetical protein
MFTLLASVRMVKRAWKALLLKDGCALPGLFTHHYFDPTSLITNGSPKWMKFNVPPELEEISMSV